MVLNEDFEKLKEHFSLICVKPCCSEELKQSSIPMEEDLLKYYLKVEDYEMAEIVSILTEIGKFIAKNRGKEGDCISNIHN